MVFAAVGMNTARRIEYSRIVLGVMLPLLISYKAHGYPQQSINLTYGVRTEYSAKGVGPVPVCEGSTFCETVPNYPLEMIIKAIEKNPGLIGHAHVELLLEKTFEQSDLPDEEPLCISIERIVYPRSAENMSKQWRYIVNYSDFLQSARIETCVEEDTSCKMIEGFAEGYVTSCKQKYIYRQLVAIDEDGNSYLDYFRFPASCCCHVQFTGEF